MPKNSTPERTSCEQCSRVLCLYTGVSTGWLCPYCDRAHAAELQLVPPAAAELAAAAATLDERRRSNVDPARARALERVSGWLRVLAAESAAAAYDGAV